MAGSLYLIDSNILIRWVQQDDPDYPVVESALNALARQKETLCYTSQNLAEFLERVHAAGQPQWVWVDPARNRSPRQAL